MKTLLLFLLASTPAKAATTAYDKIVDEMKRIEKSSSGFAKIFSIGDNDDGVPLLALRFSTTPMVADSRKAGFFIVGTHHGNEHEAPQLAMSLARAIAARFETPSWGSRLLDSEYVVLPVLNVEGLNAKAHDEKGADPNRQYDGPCATVTPTLASVKNLVTHLAGRGYAAAATLHSPGGSFTYPWGVTTKDTLTNDDAEFDRITAAAGRINGYRTGTSADIVFPANGTFEDYAYWKHGTWTWLVEILDGSADDLRTTTDAVLALFDEVDSCASAKNTFAGKCDAVSRVAKPSVLARAGGRRAPAR